MNTGGSLPAPSPEGPAAATDRLMLIDSASLYFRAFFGVPDRRQTAQAVATNAVRGFLDMLATLVTMWRPTRLIACWDEDWRPQFRVDAIPSYKTHRLAVGSATEEEIPDDLSPQVPIIANVLDAFGIARVGCPGFEADDVIGTCADGAPPGTAVDIVTGDRDLFQLVDDARMIRVLYTARGGVRSPELVTEAYLSEHYGVPDGQGYADVAVLRGDPSDGLPGVPGIGEKTATALISMFGDLAGVQQAARSGAPGLTPARRRRLLEAAEYLTVAPVVVAVARDCPLSAVDATLTGTVANPEALAALVSDFDLAGPVGRLLAAVDGR